MLPWLLLVIHAPYELALAMLSFINMYSYCWSPCHAMYCLVVSCTSSPTCLLIVVPAMYESVLYLAMFTWVPSYLLILFGSWSVRDFCSMQLVDSCHALVCYDMFLYHVNCLLWTLLPDAVYAMFSIFTKSVKLISFALLPCLFEHALVRFSRSSVFIFCQASWVD